MTEPTRRPPLGWFPEQPKPRLYDRMVEILRVHPSDDPQREHEVADHANIR